MYPFVVESSSKDGQLLYAMAHTKQTARKQPMPGLSTLQLEVSTSEEESEPVARKKPRAKKREADSSADVQGTASPPKKKSKKSKKKEQGEAATPGTSKSKKASSPKKKTSKESKKATGSPSKEKKAKSKKERYVRPRYRGTKNLLRTHSPRRRGRERCSWSIPRMTK